MRNPSPRALHWNAVYRDNPAHSWDETVPTASLSMLDAAQLSAQDSVIDVGGGSSTLVDVLLERGLSDLTVLDISAQALTASRSRLGPRQVAVSWLLADLLSWRPERHWDVWHDRAVFHFLTEPADRARYQAALRQSTRPGSHLIIGTFATDGPTHCSGLPVFRYDADTLLHALGDEYDLTATTTELHRTPFGTSQPFTWVALRRTD